MDVQLRDEAAQDRVRAATEFLDPSKYCDDVVQRTPANVCFFFYQPMHGRAGSSSCIVLSGLISNEVK